MAGIKLIRLNVDIVNFPKHVIVYLKNNAMRSRDHCLPVDQTPTTLVLKFFESGQVQV